MPVCAQRSEPLYVEAVGSWTPVEVGDLSLASMAAMVEIPIAMGAAMRITSRIERSAVWGFVRLRG